MSIVQACKKLILTLVADNSLSPNKLLKFATSVNMNDLMAIYVTNKGGRQTLKLLKLTIMRKY